jgi:hypothetical protein
MHDFYILDTYNVKIQPKVIRANSKNDRTTIPVLLMLPAYVALDEGVQK